MEMSSSDVLVPTMPCVLVTHASLLTAAPGSKTALWLDNLSLQVSQASIVSSIDAQREGNETPALLACTDAKLWLTNVDMAGAGSESAAMRLSSSQALFAGALPLSRHLHLVGRMHFERA